MPVSQLLATKFPVTIALAVMATLMIGIVGIPLGLWLAKARKQGISQVVGFVNQTLMSIPPFFLGMILTLVFGILLKWFTPGKFVSYQEDFGAFLSYLIFPALAMAIPKISMLARFTASSVKDQAKLDYVRTAYAKGSMTRSVYRKHILKNALMPVITFFGMMIADVLAGSIIIEQVFNIPGLGRILVSSIGNRDLYVVQAIMLYIVAVVVIVNFLVDVLYQLVDPRVRI